MSFDLPVQAAMSREDFIVDDANRNAFDIVTNWPNWPSNTIILAGPVGCGKSHLSSIYTTLSSSTTIDANALPYAEDLPQIADSPLLIEDIHKAKLDETRLFHLLNHTREQGSFLLITSRTWPESWALELLDLRSRLRAAHPLELNEPSDSLLKRVLVKLFADRQLNVEERVLDYLLVRMERSLSAARDLVEMLDRLSLERSRPITRQLASEVV
ncbi:MAG: DnaA/Hda family protein [Hyphomicrobiales bacterium]